MNQEKRTLILKRLQENNPHPTTELAYSSNFELLISVLLSAQATDVSVNKATALLYPVANTPAALLELGVDGIKQYIKPSACIIAKQKISLRPAGSCLMSIMVKCQKTALRLKLCPALAAKQPTWCSTPPLVGQQLP